MRTQIDDIILYFYYYAKVLSTRYPTNLKTHILKSNFIPHRPYANVLVINNSNMWNLSNPTNESKDFKF